MRKILGLTVLVLLGLTCVSLWFTKERPLLQQNALEDMGQANIGGSFTLTDQNGNQVTDANYRGKLMLVFFGFTHCPDICPTTTTTLSKTLDTLGDKAGQVETLFITVDPERDTPPVMKTYLSNFNPRIVGLTGSMPQIQQAAGAYKAYFSKIGAPWDEEAEEGAPDPHAQHMQHDAGQATDDTVAADEDIAEADDKQQDNTTDMAEDEEEGDVASDNFAVDHSAFIYLMDRSGKYIQHFPYTASSGEIVDAVSKQLQ